MLSAVLFDLDNTLIDRDAAFVACVHEHFDNPAVRDHLIVLDQGGHGDRSALLAAWTHYAGVPLSQAQLGAEIAARLRPDSHLLRRLTRLARERKIGVITNGGGAGQRAKLAAAGLDAVFPSENIWISGELGLSKPNPELFWNACRQLGEPAEACLFVGDHVTDQVGAQAAGMHFLHASRIAELSW